jgi:hypothetical protein
MKHLPQTFATLAALAVHGVIAAPIDQSELGTLFYTVNQRLAISRARHPETVLGVSDISQLQGVVRRSQGQGTVWVNGEALPESNVVAPRIKGVDAVIEGQRLRVGQSVNKSTGERSDIVDPGAVTLGTPK